MATDVQNINLSTFLSSWSSASLLKSFLKVKFLSQSVMPRYEKATRIQTHTKPLSVHLVRTTTPTSATDRQAMSSQLVKYRTGKFGYIVLLLN